jgi:hypothetical protein
LRAIAEADELGRGPFLKKHGFGRARWLALEHNGNRYDSKAIAGVALGYQYGVANKLRASWFTGGEKTVVRTLRRLGFTIVDTRTDSAGSSGAPRLEPGCAYAWQEIGDAFGFRPNYLAVGGGMLAVKQHNALVIITHPGGAKSFDYDDYWDEQTGDLIYTGKGLIGN